MSSFFFFNGDLIVRARAEKILVSFADRTVLHTIRARWASYISEGVTNDTFPTLPHFSLEGKVER